MLVHWITVTHLRLPGQSSFALLRLSKDVVRGGSQQEVRVYVCTVHPRARGWKTGVLVEVSNSTAKWCIFEQKKDLN
jgi:hypothetical protein